MMVGLSFKNKNGDVCLLAAPKKAVKISDKMVECNMCVATGAKKPSAVNKE
ncbi:MULTISPECIES: hypothetical protein [Psychrobacter]|uniref:hypothetical protein n=1 Tax=Psychrobacter TaxID=497 RepID=UPI00165DA855|nr:MULTISPECIES: hypothetical protein [Psychrobacter]